MQIAQCLVLSRSLLIALLVTHSICAQKGEITPSENLVIEGIPKIPGSIAEEMARYQTRSARLLDWHPAKREILISTRFGETDQIHIVKSPGAYRKQLTFYPDSVSGASFQPRGGNYVVFSKDSGGNGLVQLYRYDLLTGETI